MKLHELAHPAAVLPAELDGFRIELRPEQERADIVLDRPPFNVVSMLARDQLRIAFEALDADERIRVIVLRGAGEHFSSGGDIKGCLAATPEHVSKLADTAWDVHARGSHSAAVAAVSTAVLLDA